MFIAVKFTEADERNYTYAYDGAEQFEPGDRVVVETKDGQKTVIVADVDIPEPSFQCKPILGRAEEKDHGEELRKWYQENKPMIAVADAVSRGKIGHNNPPDPIDAITAAYEADREESANWLDGSAVENETQMNAVDALRKSMRQWRLDLEKGQKSAAAPLHDAWKAELARWKPTLDDAKRIEDCLVAAVDGFKRKLAAQKEAERRAAWEVAQAAQRAADEAARKAAASDLEAQRAAAAMAQAAIDAEAAAQAASRDKVKGMRTVTRHEVTDHRALLHWLAKHRKDDVTAFIDEWARKNHKPDPGADGLRVWQEQEAY